MIGDYFIPFVFMLSVLIFVHELGHFWAAKACGVRVLKFSIGFGSPIGFGRYRMRCPLADYLDQLLVVPRLSNELAGCQDWILPKQQEEGPIHIHALSGPGEHGRQVKPESINLVISRPNHQRIHHQFGHHAVFGRGIVAAG